MKSFALLSLVAAVMAMPQSSSSGSCQSSSSGSFQITTVNATSTPTRRDIGRRQLSGVLTLTLSNGILKDQAGRTGYIAANNQFQFDQPVQAGALSTSGWSLCGSNSFLALGGSTTFYQCSSGSGFYNLYNNNANKIGCITINIQAVPTSGASQIPDGQPQVTSVGKVSQITDGQPQATTPGRVSQISDGQPQATKPGSVAPATTQPLVSQISDGQPQATKPGSVAPTATKPLVSQISDGQPQATKPGNATIPPIATFTGAAAPGAVNVGVFAAGIFGLLALL